MKKCIRLPKSEYVVAWCREPVHFFVEPFFFLGSNESIPPPGSLFQQKVIAKVIAKLEHQERKGKRNVEQKGQLKNRRRKEGTRKKQRKKKRQIKHGIDEIQNKIRNQSWFGSEFNCV